MLFGLVFVCCWCLVPERGSDLYKRIFPSVKAKGKPARSRGLLRGPLWVLLASAPPSPSLQSQGLSWAVGWGAGGLDGAVHHIGLWPQKFWKPERTGTQRERQRGWTLASQRRGPALEGTHDSLTLISSSPHAFGKSGPCFLIGRRRAWCIVTSKPQKENQGEERQSQGPRAEGLGWMCCQPRASHLTAQNPVGPPCIFPEWQTHLGGPSENHH